MNSGINPEHLAKLQTSALSCDHINALGWSSDHRGRLRIPYLKPDGSPEECHDGRPFLRWRASTEWIERQIKEGKQRPPKYISPKGQGCRVYHSHLAINRGDYAERLADRLISLRITEGELKAEAANVHDPARVTVAIGGVNSWRDRYDGHDESLPLVDWDEIKLEGREVRLCFDSDLSKPQVAAALRGLAEFLSSKGAYVLIEVLPNGLDGERLGLDDLIYRHGPEVFLAIAAIARSPFKERQAGKQKVLAWAFDPEPNNSGERNVYLAGMLGNQWCRSPDGKDHWQRWNGAHWVNVAGNDEPAAEIERFADLQGWRNRELGTINSLLAAFRRRLPLASEVAEPGLLPFRNGCLRLSDSHLLPHDPAHGNTWALPYDHDNAAACPRIEAFLLDRLGDASSLAIVRAFARALLTNERLKCFLEITGPSNTGKSVVANLLVALVGNCNAAACTLQRIEDRQQRFETIKLRGKRLAVFSECQDYLGQLQTLKALTGNDSIGAEIKGGRHLDFTYTGGVVLVGNGPIRASDPTGAVINRRRSLHVRKVVQAGQEKVLLDPDGEGGWRGDLVNELPGFVNWVLAMPAEEARAALARDVNSLERAEAELESLLTTDHLAEWAEQRLSWSGTGYRQVGDSTGDHYSQLYPSYLHFMAQQGPNTKPLSLRVFKQKLVDMLRDTLGLPLPPGSCSKAPYKERNVGSVVPCIGWRTDDNSPGVISYAFRRRLGETDWEQVGNAKRPAGNGWNGWNGSETPTHRGGQQGDLDLSLKGAIPPTSVPPVPSVPHRGSGAPPAVPVEVRNSKTGRWEAGWVQVGTPKANSSSVLCRGPGGLSAELKGQSDVRRLPA